MLDHRLDTFLQLCNTMNYRETAELLHLTQPAVTQHIQYLERFYGCKLFSYDGRKLVKTDAAGMLERYARAAQYDQRAILSALSNAGRVAFRIGATKTIGDYLLPPQIAGLLRQQKYHLSVLVDNTAHLLGLLERGELDLALIEGFFDKAAYGSRLYRREPFVGVCRKEHPFSGRHLSMGTLLEETLILREPGSGTRAVLEQLLQQENLSPESFRSTCCVSSFEITRQLVVDGLGISFVYQAVADSDPRLDTFTLEGPDITREMNYVYLQNSSAGHWIDVLEQAAPPPRKRP